MREGEIKVGALQVPNFPHTIDVSSLCTHIYVISIPQKLYPNFRHCHSTVRFPEIEFISSGQFIWKIIFAALPFSVLRNHRLSLLFFHMANVGVKEIP